MFNSMDKNGDGKVSRIEMIQALRKDPDTRKYLGLPATFKQGSPEHAAFEAVFQRMDNDDSREITWAEFQRLTFIGCEDETTNEITKPPHLLALALDGAVESWGGGAAAAGQGLPFTGAPRQDEPYRADSDDSEETLGELPLQHAGGGLPGSITKEVQGLLAAVSPPQQQHQLLPRKQHATPPRPVFQNGATSTLREVPGNATVPGPTSSCPNCWRVLDTMPGAVNQCSECGQVTSATHRHASQPICVVRGVSSRVYYYHIFRIQPSILLPLRCSWSLISYRLDALLLSTCHSHSHID